MAWPRLCYACGSRTSDAASRCDCGEPLWLALDPPSDWPVTNENSIWRYREWLPVDAPAGIGAAAGGTPLVRTRRLDDLVDCRVHLKLESTNPTGTFKDRGSAVGVAATSGPLGTVSHGNMAISVAAHAAASGRPCSVLVPDDIPVSRLRQIAEYDPRILRVTGDYGELYDATIKIGSQLGIRFLNSDTPLRVAGQKTTGLEICEAFAPDTPDAVVLPVSSGGHASGIWQAFRDLETAGLIQEPPALYLVQAAACSPIADAYQAAQDTVSAVEPAETIAYSIANPDPPSGTRALTAARETGGGVIAVDEEAIREAMTTFAEVVGVSAEPASAVTLAGLEKLTATKQIAQNDDVVLVVTGTGFRNDAAGSVTTETIPQSELAETLKAHH